MTFHVRERQKTYLHFLEQGSSLSIVLKVIPHRLQNPVQGDCQGILQVTCTGTKTVVLFTLWHRRSAMATVAMTQLKLNKHADPTAVEEETVSMVAGAAVV